MQDGKQDELRKLSAEIEALKQQRQQEAAALEALIRISVQLTSTLKLSELLQQIMHSAKELFRAEACSVVLRDEETDELIFAAAAGEKNVDRFRVPPGQGIAGRVVGTGEPVIANSVQEHPDFYGAIDEATGMQTRNMLAVPLMVKDRTIGAVEIMNAQGREGFDQRDLKWAQALAGLAAVAIDNANLYQKLSDALVTSRMSYRV